MSNKISVKVLENRQISRDSFVLRLERNDFLFTAGQYLVVSFPNEREAREYSIYSGENDPWLEILIKSVPEGSFSHHLSQVKTGDTLNFEGPFGYFVLRPNEIAQRKHIFVATGTGISPFASYIKTYGQLNYELWHGIATLADSIEPHFYAANSLKLCISKEKSNHFNGRVTQYLRQHLDKDAVYYLCGNSAMINDMTELLETMGVNPVDIRTEAFF
jgi:ferredoxin/flavodoxin---NADP+ reductase